MTLLLIQDSYGDFHVMDEPTYDEMRSEQYPDEYTVKELIHGSETIKYLMDNYGFKAAKQIFQSYYGVE